MANYSSPGAPPPPPMMGMHTGRIPSFKNSHGENFQTRPGFEPPACVQNAMMTKDKKPFTYTPGGLDLSQIKTPSMARRLNKQQQQSEDQENPAYFRQPSYNGGPSMPPPPPSGPPPPPPPPPLVINVTKPTKAVSEGERPEIVIPENPIGMLRKTHSPYHWESEMADRIQQGPVPKFIEKSATPSPVAPQMRKTQPQQYQQPPQQFSQQPPQAYLQQSPQQYQSSPGMPSRVENNIQQKSNKSPSTSPIWKPEPKYPGSPQPSNSTPSFNNASPNHQHQTPTKDLLQRQDSQFNLSPSPWGKESPFSNSSSTTTSSNSNSTISPSYDSSNAKSATPVSNSASPWKQDTRNLSMQPDFRNSPSQMQNQRSPLSPSQSIRTPNQSPYIETSESPRPNYQNAPMSPQQNAAPWRQQQQQQQQQQVTYPPNFQVNNSQSQSVMNNQNHGPGFNQQSRPGFIKPFSPIEQNAPQQFPNSGSDSDNELRYQTHMTIPVTPRKGKNEQQAMSNQNQPTTPKSAESPKENIPWARANAANKTTPPPPWCQRPAENRKSVPRDSVEQTESPVQPPWGQRPSENRKSLPREIVQVSSPPSSEPQPPWVADRRYETLPRAQNNKVPLGPSASQQIIQNIPGRMIPVHMEVSQQEIKQNHGPGMIQSQMKPQGKNQQPQLRIIIDMNQQGQPGQPNKQTQQPQQHIARILQPQMMRMDGAVLGSPVRQEPTPSAVQQQRTRIIPIQMEPSSPVTTSPSRRN